MATVYRARDRKHDRDVAIKVLHPDLGAALGADRFLAEIRTTARLQHPHILPLLDSGAADGVLYYVMPLVTGETLRARLERERQLPIGDALRITREVASALEHAHRQGVIHRDIKPENILLQDGQALVADFGIALAVAGDGGERLTSTGLSLGTPQYMSPEQAMGERTIDARSDVYALGAVCYEMLAGEPPYTGNSLQAIVARVLSERPTALRTLRETVPPHVEAAVFTALARLPADRFASVRAFADALGDVTHVSDVAETRRTTGRRNAWRDAAVAGALVAAAAVAGAAWLYARDASASRDIGLPPDAPIRMADIYRNFAVAHDGTFIVYEARTGESSQLWYRSLVRDELRAIPGTDGAYGTPRLSPDDQRVAFAAGGELRIVSVTGGAVTTIAKVGDPSGGAWLGDATILVADDDGTVLRRIDVDGGPGRDVRVRYCILPSLLPDARTVLCGGGAEKFAGAHAQDGADSTRWFRRTAGAGEGGARLKGSDFRVVDGRYLVYIGIDGTLMATRIEDAASLRVGKSVALVPAVRRSGYSGAGQFDIASNGTLVYAPGVNAEVGRLVRWSASGTTVPLLPEAAAYLRFEPTRDGRRLATVVETAIEQELRIHDLVTGRQETVDKGGYLGSMAWSPDGRTLVYWRRGPEGDDREALVALRVDSAAPPRLLLPAPPGIVFEAAAYVAADSLLVGSIGGPTLLIDPTTTPVHIDTLPISALFVSMSPDRRWIAYTPREQRGVVVQPVPSFGRRYRVSATGQEPRWRSAGDLAFWVTNAGGQATTASIQHVSIGAPGDAPVSAPSLLVADPRFSDTPGWSQAIMPGGDIVYMQGPAEMIGSYVRVVPGWVAAMKRAVDAANR